MGFVSITLQDTSRKWPIQYIHNFADIDLMPCVLLYQLLIWEAIRIRILVVQRGHVLTQATC